MTLRGKIYVNALKSGQENPFVDRWLSFKMLESTA